MLNNKIINAISGDIQLNKLYADKKVPNQQFKILKRTPTSEIKVYIDRDEKYMTKITTKFGDIPFTLKKSVQNLGTPENPNMATTGLQLMLPKSPGNSLVIYFNKPGDINSGVYINLFRKNMYKLVKQYNNLQDLRQDKELLEIVGKWLGKDLITPNSLKPKSSEAVGNNINTYA